MMDSFVLVGNVVVDHLILLLNSRNSRGTGASDLNRYHNVGILHLFSYRSTRNFSRCLGTVLDLIYIHEGAKASRPRNINRRLVNLLIVPKKEQQNRIHFRSIPDKKSNPSYIIPENPVPYSKTSRISKVG